MQRKQRVKKLIQAKLQKLDKDEQAILVCWLDKPHIVRPGRVITLKDSDDPTAKWIIMETYAIKNANSINQDWTVEEL